MTDSKTCTCCLASKPLFKFAGHKLTKDRHASWCMACARKNASWDRAVRYGLANGGPLSLDDWCIRATKLAISNGLLKRPDACDLCAMKINSLIPYHLDQARPLDVIWRCPACRREKK